MARFAFFLAFGRAAFLFLAFFFAFLRAAGFGFGAAIGSPIGLIGAGVGGAGAFRHLHMLEHRISPPLVVCGRGL
ncbi:MAG: hypothetical protein AUI55_03295 [Gemmatimonadetes bacterium 13_1_40CM_2_70_7]|nr:MAG: hypothetical protein AUI55_03295 [Gemmatimonadetes bacterium 13_1_40CM_2_70_7]